MPKAAAVTSTASVLRFRPFGNGPVSVSLNNGTKTLSWSTGAFPVSASMDQDTQTISWTGRRGTSPTGTDPLTADYTNSDGALTMTTLE